MRTIFKGEIGQAKSVLAKFETGAPHTAGQVRMAVGSVLVADGLVGLEDPFDGKKARPAVLGALAHAAFAGIFLFAGLFVLGALDHYDATTTGTVSWVSEPTRADDSGACTAKALFDVDGKAYTAVSDSPARAFCNLRLGTEIGVWYDTADPSKSMVGEPVANPVAWVFVAAGAALLFGALVTLTLRVAAIVFGVMLIRSGRRMVAENPKSHGDAGLVVEARRAIVNLIKGHAFDAHLAGDTPRRPRRRRAGAGAVAESVARHVTSADADPVEEFVDEPAPAPEPDAAPSVVPTLAPAAAPRTTPQAIPAGWYATADGRHLRWHDGTTWTDHVRSAPPTPSDT